MNERHLFFFGSSRTCLKSLIGKNQGIMLDKINEKPFSRLTALLMNAAQSAGIAGLEAFHIDKSGISSTTGCIASKVHVPKKSQRQES